MEIFKLFNSDWQVSSDKIKVKNSKSPILHQNIYEKEGCNVLKQFTKKTEDYEIQLKAAKEREESLEEELKETKQKISELVQILTDYDDLVEDLVKERNAFRNEKEVSVKHLANLEFSFSDLHSKYERSKSVVDGFKQNQDTLLQCIENNELSINELNEQCEMLKETSTHEIIRANSEILKLEKEHEVEVSKLQSRIKKLTITIGSLEHNLQQKILENEQLSSMCDDLIYSNKGYGFDDKDYVSAQS